MHQSKQIDVLSNLRPETVIGIEGVFFTNKARAMPGVLDASDDSYCDAETLTGEEIDIKEQLGIAPDTNERSVVMENYIVAGGLCYDHDCEGQNPFSGDCANGNLYHRGRRASGDEESSFYHAMGMDSSGDKDLKDERVSDELVAHVTATIRNDRSLMTTLSNLLRSRDQACTWDAVLKKVGEAVYQEGWEYALDYIADYFLDCRWWMDLDEEWRDKLDLLACNLDESSAENAWERAVATGTMGNPLAVMIDIYEHGGVSYSVSGGGMQCRWDTTRGGAVWVPDTEAEANIRYKVLENLGVGQVKWSGAAGSQNDPLHAQYSLDGGQTWMGNFAKWNQAVDAMLVASGRSIDQAELNQLMYSEAVKYCATILEEYNSWANGDVYGVVIYVIDRETGERIDVNDDECWGYVGHSYAEQTLEEGILSKVVELSQTLQ